MLHIFTDSLTTLPHGLAEQLNIGIAPVYVVFSNTQIYKHMVDIPTEKIFSLVMETGKVPGIAAPTIEDLVQLFKPSVSRNDQVLFISMSAEISSTCRNAKAAAKHFPKGQVTVMDSTHFSSGTAMMILQAESLSRKMRKLGSLEQKLKAYRMSLKEELFLDKLQRVSKAGNIYGLQDRIISPLKLKPRLNIRTGSINSVLKAAGQQASMPGDLLLSKLNGPPAIGRDLIVISHTLAEEPAEYVKSKLKEVYGFKRVLLASNITGLLCRTAPRSLEISYSFI